jgi:MFS family permease
MGQIDEAAEVMGIMYDCDTQDEEVQTELRDMQLSMELNGSVSLWSMFKMGPQRTFHRVCLAALIQIFLQMTGTNAVIYYSTTLFSAQLGFSSTLSYILAGCLQFTLVIGSLICSFTVDRYGRRPLMLISAALTSISMACLAGLTSNPNNSTALKAATFFVFFFETCYCLGFLGIPFLYASEVAPVHLRAAVCGVSTAISWLFKYVYLLHR